MPSLEEPAEEPAEDPIESLLRDAPEVQAAKITVIPRVVDVDSLLPPEEPPAEEVA